MSAKKSVMILEDEVLVAFDLAAIVGAEGYAVFGPFHRVDPALEALERDLPDVAILDVNLGDETSEPVAWRLSDLGVPFAFATGYSSGKAEVPTKFAGVACLSKPVQPLKLYRLLAEKVASR